ncbi:MAG: radical SAM protein [Candidatus Bathyarchaeota archaeon]|nr:radical SAM protein [Candidatus Bathyarchaeum tardum]WGM90607.1 MAG: radical SAM protein [Candidatus Bathyarchaeum tardum]
MEGSLLYHMAMISKMSSEHRIVLEELNVDEPEIEDELWQFYADFVSDTEELLDGIIKLNANAVKSVKCPAPDALEKIDLFRKLSKKTKKVEDLLKQHAPESLEEIQNLFEDWTLHVVEMRLRQEYETIKGFLIIEKIVEDLGIEQVAKGMRSVQKSFGDKTVDSAFEVSLKVGLSKEKLQKLMLSDHFIEYKMDMKNLGGFMRFLNCPIHGSHKYMEQKNGKSNQSGQLFCKIFCKAHAQSMFGKFIPFPVAVSQPLRMATDGKCEYQIKLAPNSEEKTINEKYVPLVISWNMTLRCNLKCAHCYINAEGTKATTTNELSTDASKMLIHQITEVSKPLLILSGGEPLLREDIYDIIKYGADRGLRMGMGSNGMLIDDEVAKKLKEAGMWTVAISLDSSKPERHDEFRGVKGCWKHAINAIKALKKAGIEVQVNCTVTQQNYDEVEDIMALAENLGVENFHLFFLVPTGRGTDIQDITPHMYEEMIAKTLAKTTKYKLNVKPSCAPQFMRVAKDQGVDMSRWVRGCMAGLYYCRIYPSGEVTPCPYMPVNLGNIREKSFKDIWFNSEVFNALRDFNKLKGKCGECEHNEICGGCRARAYGVTTDQMDFCGALHEPTELKGDYLAEDPWCIYQPKSLAQKKKCE